MTGDKPHVVGVVGNDITNDSRVKKVAASAAAAGLRSTILCFTASGKQRETNMGAVRVIRVPVTFAAKSKNGRVPSPIRPFNAQELASRHAGPRVHLLARRRWLEGQLYESSNSGGQHMWLQSRLLWTRISLKVRREGFRIRKRIGVLVDRVLRKLALVRVRTSLKLFRGIRDAVPNIADYELAFGPILEELRPDLIHAHDYHMIGIAVTAARKLRRAGTPTKVIYDAHEWISGLSYPQSTLDGWLKLESEYIDKTDGVIGVSPEQIAQIQERYHLRDRPTLVLNAPVVDGADDPESDIRSDIGVSGPIIAYHGKTALARGLGTLIESLQYLDEDTHVGILALKGNPVINEIEELSVQLGVENRTHILDYVPAEQLPAYLFTADMAVIPYLLTGNNDIALPNKLFEAIQGNLPVLVSDMRAMSRFIHETGVGEVFANGDPFDLAAKARLILKNLDDYRVRITPELKTELSWTSQAEKLVELYGRVMGEAPIKQATIRAHDVLEGTEVLSSVQRPKRLAIGPRNMAGQAYSIAAAVQTNLSIPAVSFTLEKAGYRFPTHIDISDEQWRDPRWQRNQLNLLAQGFTHVLAESGTGMLGSMNGGFIDDQLEMLQDAGLQVAVLLHGSEIRDPARHRLIPNSPYAIQDDYIRSVEQAAERLRDHLDRIDIPVFVTTPDLLQDIDATWVPVALDVKPWSALREPFQDPTPTVLHLPTSKQLKGSEHIDRVLSALDSEGMIHYLRPEAGMAARNVPALVEKADIVVDQIVIGAYGLMSCQTMAAGRLSIANIRDIGFLSPECPVIHAEPDSLEAVLRELLDQEETWASRGEAGREFVSKYHSGSATAEILSDFLNVDHEE